MAARIGPESAKQFPGIASACRIAGLGRLTMGNDPGIRGYEQLVIADANFFQFFNFPLLQGDPTTCLTEPNGIVISKKLAIRYFGTVDALNKSVWIDGDDMYVTGVMDDFPSNSHLSFDLMWSQATVDRYLPDFRRFETSDWSRNSFATYIKTDPRQADDMAVNITNLVGQNYPVDKVFKSKFYLQPLKDIHLYSAGIQDYQVNLNGFNRFYVYIFILNPCIRISFPLYFTRMGTTLYPSKLLAIMFNPELNKSKKYGRSFSLSVPLSLIFWMIVINNFTKRSKNKVSSLPYFQG